MNVFKLTGTLDKYVDFYKNDPNEAEVLVVGGSKIELENYPKLKYIFKCGVGVDNIPDLEGTGVELIMPSDETKQSIYDEVSSFAVYSILNAHFRNSGNMEEWKKVQRPSLSEKKVLIVGHCGHIGSMTYAKLEPMFSEVKGYDISVEDQEPLNELMKEADIISLHVPLMAGTKSMIDLSVLKEDVILVNTARAGVVDEDWLYEFLQENPEATAAFDVFWEEPYRTDSPLFYQHNFIATPHIASSGDGFQKGLYRDLLELLKE